jgi:large repetitive protein
MRLIKLRCISTGTKSAFAVIATFCLFLGSLTAAKNEKPTISGISPSSATAGGPGFILTVEGSNYVSDSQVNWNGASRPTAFVSSTQLTAAIAANDIAIAGTARVTVTNPDNEGKGKDNLTSNDVTFTINNPEPTIARLSPSSATAGASSFTLSVQGSNFVNESTVRWNGSNRSTIFISTSELTAAIPSNDIATAGSARVTVINPAPGGGTSNPLTFTINPASLPLKITTSSPLPNGTVGTAYSQTLVATGGTPPYSWSISAGSLPAGLSLNPSSGVISGAPTSAGNFNFSAQVTDSSDTKSAKDFILGINNLVPTVTTLSPSSAVAGGPAFTLSVRGSNFVTDSMVRWKGSNRPTTFVSSTELAVAIPASDIATAGTADVAVFNAPPGGGTSNLLTFTITAAPTPLTITATSPLPNGNVGTTYSQAIGATGGTQPYAWSVTAGSLPPGLTLASSSGVLSGTPSAAGSFQFTLQVSDSAQPTPMKSTKEFAISVTNPVPVITTLSPSNSTAGSAGFTLILFGSNFVEGVSTVQWNGTNRVTTFSGSSQLNAAIPASDIAVPGSATVTVFNPGPGGGTSNALTFTISPAALNLTIITSSPLPTGVTDKTYSQVLAASGGTPPYIWSISAGTLPPGLTLDSSTGAINGIPTTRAVFNFTAQVTDNAKATSSKALSIEITGSGSTPPPTITTGSPLADGTVGLRYEQSLVATDGSPPYSWSITAGALPGGLVLDSPSGLISGTPSTSGTFSFTVQVVDSLQTNAAKEFTVSINPPLPELVITGLTDSVDPAQQPKIGLEASAPYPLLLSGKMTLSFTANAVNPSDDPAIQFSSGGRVVSFTIPANSTEALFPGNTAEAAFQTGTVAGTIKLEVILQVGGKEVTPSPDPNRTVTVNRGAPTITSVTVGSKSGSAFEVIVVGFSTPRSLDQATFHFSPREGKILQTPTVSLQVGATATPWYQSETSNRFGSQFRFVVPFTIQGDLNSIGSVSVTLTNAEGASKAASTSL